MRYQFVYQVRQGQVKGEVQVRLPGEIRSVKGEVPVSLPGEIRSG